MGIRTAFAALVGLALWMSATAAAAPPIEAYGRLPGFEQAALSPSGDRQAIIGLVGEKRTLLVFGPDQKPLLTMAIGGNKVRRILWAGEQRLLVWVSMTVTLGIEFTTAKHEAQTVMVVDVDGRSSFPVFGNRKDIFAGVSGFHGIVERNGRWYGFFGGITLAPTSNQGEYAWDDGFPELFRVDLQDGRAVLVERGQGDTHRDWLVGPDGTVTARLDYFPKNGSWRLIHEPTRREIASGVEPIRKIWLIGPGRTPDTVLYQKSAEGGGEDWIEVALDGSKSTEILGEEHVLDSITDPRRGLLIGYRRDGDRPEDHFFDSRYERRMAAARKAFPNLAVELVDWNDAFDRLIVKTEGDGDSGTWWLVDLRTGKATDLGFSYPAIKAADVGPTRLISYKAADGLDIQGILTLPPGGADRNLPIVVMPHGGPHWRDYLGFDYWAQAFASRGYAVFQPNFRGSTGYGAAFRDAGKGEWGRKMQTDISDGLAELVRRGIVDPKRACIMGGSYGGYAALAGVTLQQGLYRCAVSVNGVSDLTQFSIEKRERSGHERDDRLYWKEAIGSGRQLRDGSPAQFAERADAPVLLIHGKEDTVVSFAQSQLMERKLKAAGKPVSLVVLAGEDHWLSLGETRLAMLKASVEFVERHNPVGSGESVAAR